MNAITVLIISLIGIGVGYFLYAKTIDRSIIRPDGSKTTPAKMFMDGVDFTPANRNVLFGYQFKSVAALGPIVGPIVAVRWGWLPALLWVILGTMFIGWVQDYGSIIVGVREEGQTFGALSFRLISRRARTILLLFIYAYLLLIMAAFGKIVGFDLMTNPAVPLGVLLVMVLGMAAGHMTYKLKMDILVTTGHHGGSFICRDLAGNGWTGQKPVCGDQWRSDLTDPVRQRDLGAVFLEPRCPGFVLSGGNAADLAMGATDQLCRLLDCLSGHPGRHDRTG